MYIATNPFWLKQIIDLTGLVRYQCNTHNEFYTIRDEDNTDFQFAFACSPADVGRIIGACLVIFKLPLPISI